MAALSEDVLRKLITPNAKALSSPNGDKMIDEGFVGKADDFDDSMFLAETYNPEGDTQVTKNYSIGAISPEKVRSSKMNSAILQDIVNHPIDTTPLNTQLLESAGNGDAVTNNARLNKMLSGAKMVEEKLGNPTTKVPVNGQRNAGSGMIDYALIKTIINEAIDTKLNELLQDGELRIIRFNKGKLKVIDNGGNIYSAPLKYEGNIKDRNKGDK